MSKTNCSHFHLIPIMFPKCHRLCLRLFPWLGISSLPNLSIFERNLFSSPALNATCTTTIRFTALVHHLFSSTKEQISVVFLNMCNFLFCTIFVYAVSSLPTRITALTAKLKSTHSKHFLSTFYMLNTFYILGVEE